MDNWFLIIALSFIAGLGFSFIFQVKKRHLLLAAVCSSTSWTLFQFLMSIGINSVFSTLMSGLVIGFMTEIFAKIKKCPAINYIIIGIIPLVPGLKVYQGMLKLIEGDIFPGISLLLEAAFIAIAIGVSILVSTSVARVIRLRKQKKLIKYQHPNAPN